MVTQYKTPQNALQNLVKKENPLCFTPFWFCPSNQFRFSNQFGSNQWEWMIKPDYHCAKDHPLVKLARNIHSFQTSGFKTRKDAVNYVEALVGKGTPANHQLLPLSQRRPGYYVLKNSPFEIYKTGQKTGWKITNSVTGGFYPNQLCNNRGFQTRLAALEYLFSKGLLV